MNNTGENINYGEGIQNVSAYRHYYIPELEFHCIVLIFSIKMCIEDAKEKVNKLLNSGNTVLVLLDTHYCDFTFPEWILCICRLL